MVPQRLFKFFILIVSIGGVFRISSGELSGFYLLFSILAGLWAAPSLLILMAPSAAIASWRLLRLEGPRLDNVLQFALIVAMLIGYFGVGTIIFLLKDDPLFDVFVFVSALFLRSVDIQFNSRDSLL